MKNLGSDMILGDVTAKNITCQSINIENSDQEDLKAKSLEADDITANQTLYVSNNAMVINNTTTSSTISLLGNSAATVGQYLTEVYSDSTDTYALEQLTAGDNGAQSLIFTAGGGYEDSVKNSIQSYDSYRKTPESLYLNPLGGDVIAAELTATTGNFDVINVQTLNIENPDDPTNPANINCESITASTGNINNLTTDAITSSSITVTSSVACNSLTSQSTTSDYITANEKLKVSNNCMIINNCLIDSTTTLLGNSGETVGDYLTELYPGSTSSYALEQLAAGDNGSQSIILTAGGSFGDDTNSIQSYDTNRTEKLDLHLNPLGGIVFVSDLKPVNQTMGAACYMIKPNFGNSTFICTIRQLASDGVDNDQDQDLLWCVNPGFKIIVYRDSDFQSDSETFDNTNGLVPIYEDGLQDATSIQVFFNSVEINPFGF